MVSAAENKKRIPWLDVGKGIAMLFVMLSHTIWVPDVYGQFFRPIYLSFFFIASGYVFSLKKDFPTFLRNKARTLLIPLFSLGMINMLSSQIITTGNHNLKDDFIGMLLQIRGKNDYMWFVACLFLAEIIFYFIVKYVPEKFSPIICFFGLLLSYILAKNDIGPLPWHLQTMGTAIFFLEIGHLLKNHDTKIRRFFSLKYFIISLFIFIVVMVIKLAVINDWNTVKVNDYSSGIILWLAVSISANMFFIQFIRFIGHCKWLEFIGRNTLVYFAFQFKFQRIFEVIADRLHLLQLPAAEWYISFVSVAFEAVCLACCAWFFNRYLFVFLGKRRP